MARGEKFTEKYGVTTANIYKGNTEALKIPGPEHPLFDPTAPTTFDELRVQQIDADGAMTTPIEVWTDPDTRTLWVVDGRGRALDVQEVNRRRKKDGREPVQPYIVPFSGDEKAAVARVRVKNYHRRTPTVSGMGLDLLALRRMGYSWEACAAHMHVATKDAEQWGRKLLPLAFCIPEVRTAIDDGAIPKNLAPRFGGTALDGTKALGKKEQQELLAQLLKKSEAPKPKRGAGSGRAVPPKARERIVTALRDASGLRAMDHMAAKMAAAVIARLEGDPKALKEWPAVEEIFSAALQPAEKRKKAEKEAA